MSANPNPAQIDVTRETIVACVDGYISGGMEPNAAFTQVFEDIDRLGQLEDLARLMGTAMIGEAWRVRNRSVRAGAGGVEYRQHTPVSNPELPTPIAAPRPRVIALEPLKKASLLDGMYKVGGQWVRLGDMDRGLCHGAFKQYRDSAISDEWNARYFRAIEETLTDGQTVQQKFDDAKLMKLYERAKPSGNTLS